MSAFQIETGDWTRYRRLRPEPAEVDFHDAENGPGESPYEEGMRNVPGPIRYENRMWTVYKDALDALKEAYDDGTKWVIFKHGSSTSRPGKTTARSQVRKLMRSRAATPYIYRNKSIQHDSVFVAAIRSSSKDRIGV